MGYTFEYGNDKFLSTSGGSIATITDNDTGKILPVNLKHNRNSTKTGVLRNGNVYETRVNEPSFNLVDGVMALTTEPQAENLVQNSGLLTVSYPPTNWSSSGAIANILVSNKFSQVNAFNFINRSYISQSFSFQSAETYVLSCYVEDILISEKIDNVLRFVHSGTKTFFKNGVSISGSTNIEAGNFYSAKIVTDSVSTDSIRWGLGVSNSSTTSNIKLSLPQLEAGDKRTSFILSPIGATAVRLADTGIETGDISQYIDSTNFTLETEQSSFNDGSSTYEIGLNNGTFSTATRLSYSTTIGRILAAISKAGETPFNLVANGVSKEDFNKTKITVKGQNASLFINDVLQDSSTFFGYSQGDLKFLSLDNGQGSSSFKGKIKSIKIS